MKDLCNGELRMKNTRPPPPPKKGQNEGRLSLDLFLKDSLLEPRFLKVSLMFYPRPFFCPPGKCVSIFSWPWIKFGLVLLFDTHCFNHRWFSILSKHIKSYKIWSKHIEILLHPVQNILNPINSIFNPMISYWNNTKSYQRPMESYWILVNSCLTPSPPNLLFNVLPHPHPP